MLFEKHTNYKHELLLKMLFLGKPLASVQSKIEKCIRFQSDPSSTIFPFFILFKNYVFSHAHCSHRNYLLMEITHINQTKYVHQARPQMAMNFLSSRAHYMNWTKIISVSCNSTKFTLIRIIHARQPVRLPLCFLFM